MGNMKDGFSLPLVLVAALMVLLGGLMLVDRSSDGVISAAFQGDSADARDAAETGMTRILGELNRVSNRGLLVKPGSESDKADFLWGEDDLNPATSRNRCTSSGPDLDSTTTQSIIGYKSTGSPYRVVYLGADGQVVNTAATATKAYQLLSVQRMPLVNEAGQATLRIFNPEGRGSVTMVIEGSSLRNGRVLSSVRLEKTFQLVPKCCGLPFGGAHGNVNYDFSPDGNSVCIGAEWGFVAGAAQNNTGYLKINGVTTIRKSNGDLVNPLTCIADSQDDCEFYPTSTPYSMQPAPKALDPSRMPVNAAAGKAPATINKNAVSDGFVQCIDTKTTPYTQLTDCKNASEVILDPSIPLRNTTPTASDYCTPTTVEGIEELHCTIALLDYSSFNLVVRGTTPSEGTSNRRLRLFFPNPGPVIRSTGSATITHTGENATDFALLGCPNCTDQSINLAGSSDGLNIFAWFPQGNVTLSGSSGYKGVLWANKITSNGGVTWEIPGSGVAAALKLAGFGLSGDLNPPVFDWVARATHSFRWFGR